MRNSFHESKPERMIFFEQVSQTRPVQRHRSGSALCTSVEVPSVGCHHPGPAQYVARLNGLNVHGAFSCVVGLESNSTLSQHVKSLGLLALTKEVVTLLILDFAGAAHYQVQSLWFKAMKERMMAQEMIHGLHSVSPPLKGLRLKRAVFLHGPRFSRYVEYRPDST
jgi:hypothetical protein